jgi:hypothetical protein
MPTKTFSPPVIQVEIGDVKPPKKPIWHYILIIVLLISALSAAMIILLSGGDEEVSEVFHEKLTEEEITETAEYVGVDNLPQWVEVLLIGVDGASRRGEKLEGVRDIAVHYVANPGSSARANRNYFDSSESTVSSHFIVGLEGEVILCVPLDEKSSATNQRNADTISIEVCHPDTTGQFLPETEESLVRLLAWLCGEFDLEVENIIRHYDVTGKMCPLYYVEHEEEWKRLKEKVSLLLYQEK